MLLRWRSSHSSVTKVEVKPHSCYLGGGLVTLGLLRWMLSHSSVTKVEVKSH